MVVLVGYVRVSAKSMETATSGETLVLHVFGALAGFERELIGERMG